MPRKAYQDMINTPDKCREKGVIEIVESDIVPAYIRRKMPSQGAIDTTVRRLSKFNLADYSKHMLVIMHHWPQLAFEVIFALEIEEKQRIKKEAKEKKKSLKEIRKKKGTTKPRIKKERNWAEDIMQEVFGEP